MKGKETRQEKKDEETMRPSLLDGLLVYVFYGCQNYHNKDKEAMVCLFNSLHLISDFSNINVNQMIRVKTCAFLFK